MKSHTPSVPIPFGHRLSVLTFLLLSFSFLASLDAQTPPFRWAARAGSTFYDDSRGIAVDAAGNSYVTGYFQSLATFGRTNQVTLFTQIGGDFDIFVAKYDGTGELVWVNQAGGTLDDVGYGIAVDSAGNSFVTGYFNSPTAAFGTNNLNNSNILATNSP